MTTASPEIVMQGAAGELKAVGCCWAAKARLDPHARHLGNGSVAGMVGIPDAKSHMVAILADMPDERKNPAPTTPERLRPKTRATHEQERTQQNHTTICPVASGTGETL